MKSFRTELENPIVEKDIIDLEKKISAFHLGKVDEERFRSLRLARGIYGQRQPGVQMIRIKIPFGEVSAHQLETISDISDEYSTGKLHITTRQDVQIHYVSLDDTPELWAKLEANDITLREACGNTVRNVTASELAGVDPNEAFDVTPYAQLVFKYFLRNPICQEMGRKVKFAFSSSAEDSALTYIHDLGFIPKINLVNGIQKRGFKVLLGGGLGSQPRQADVVNEFLPEEELLFFTEGVLRVFDRFGERTRRQKARLKFLIDDIGKDEFLNRVREEYKAIPNQNVTINNRIEKNIADYAAAPVALIPSELKNDLDKWFKSNVISQKQKGFYAVGIRVELGDFTTKTARLLAKLIRHLPSSEFRFTITQNIVLRYVPIVSLEWLYLQLKKLDLVQSGYHSLADVTTCPGTDTCNLGIANSTGLSSAISRLIETDFPEYLDSKNFDIKISGCMNSCGQHMIASIGFQGMTIKSGNSVAPAVQVVLGGVNYGDGQGRFAKKVIKLPSKRALTALSSLLTDYKLNGDGLPFYAHFEAKGEKYFYDLLKPLSTGELSADEFLDWGQNEQYKKEIGVGECAGVVIDLIATLLQEAEEKYENALFALEQKKWADAIYGTYNTLINAAKAVLLKRDVQCNTQSSIIEAYEEIHLEEKGESFADLVYKIKHNTPSEDFATKYLAESKTFLENITQAHQTTV